MKSNIGRYLLRHLLFCFLTAFFPSVSSARVLISEVAWMGTPESSLGEWVELYNDGSSPVSLAGASLFESGGSTPVVTLTKTIEAGGYLVIERTTPSLPDPLPGINDEAGSFGGGGLSNSGEFLVLKDVSGAILDSVNALEGWPAGSATTKETMQLFNGQFVTGTATPKMIFPGFTQPPGGQQSGSSSVAQTSSSQSVLTSSGEVNPKKEKVGFDPGFSIGTDRVITAGTEIEFSARTSREVLSPRIAWSFGDGSSLEGARVRKTFWLPGTYAVVSVLTNSQGESVADQIRVSVEEPVVMITSREVGARPYTSLYNAGRQEVNIGRWALEYSSGTFVLPLETVLLPGVETPFPKLVTGFSASSESVSLRRPDGSVYAISDARVVPGQLVSSSSPHLVVGPSRDETILLLRTLISRLEEVLHRL